MLIRNAATAATEEEYKQSARDNLLSTTKLINGGRNCAPLLKTKTLKTYGI